MNRRVAKKVDARLVREARLGRRPRYRQVTLFRAAAVMVRDLIRENRRRLLPAGGA